MQIGTWKSCRMVMSMLVIMGIALWMPAVSAAGDVSSSVDLKFWGRAIFNMHYDTAQQYLDFMSYLTEDVESFNFNPRDTRLGFSASHRNGDWTYGSVFEIDFYGSNSGNNLLPRLRLGYVEAKNSEGLSIRAGQDWIPVAQQNPGTLDFGIQSWSGNLWWRVPQLTARYRNDKVEYLLGVMKHRVSNEQERQEMMPWIMGRIGLVDLMGSGSLLAIGGAWRSVTVDYNYRLYDLPPGSYWHDPNEYSSFQDSNEYSPYLGALEFVMPFGDSGVVLNGEAYYGAGFSREFIHYGFDYNPLHPDGALAIKSLGGFASLKVPVSPRVDVNVGFGMDQPDEDDLVVAEQSSAFEGATYNPPYVKNTSFFGNMKYKVTKNFGWGLEAAHFITDQGGDDGELTGQRFTASWWFIF
jgi:hypothetical protein